jgi:hypothetical protein
MSTHAIGGAAGRFSPQNIVAFFAWLVPFSAPPRQPGVPVRGQQSVLSHRFYRRADRVLACTALPFMIATCLDMIPTCKWPRR